MVVSDISKPVKLKMLANSVKKEWESWPKVSEDPIEDFAPLFKELLSKLEFEMVSEEQFVSNALDAYQERLSDDFCDTGNDLLEFILEKMLRVKHMPEWHYESLLKLIVK